MLSIRRPALVAAVKLNVIMLLSEYWIILGQLMRGEGGVFKLNSEGKIGIRTGSRSDRVASGKLFEFNDPVATAPGSDTGLGLGIWLCPPKKQSF